MEDKILERVECESSISVVEAGSKSTAASPKKQTSTSKRAPAKKRSATKRLSENGSAGAPMVNQVKDNIAASGDAVPNNEGEAAHNIDLGRRGEEAAVRFLERRGYEVVERNWVCSAGEADVIVQDEQTLVFVEVKTRSNCDKGMPADAITAAKRQRYEKIAASYLRTYEGVDVSVRFDVISILTVSSDRAFLRHHINAFSCGE